MSEPVALSVPPRGKWIATESGVARWRAAFDTLEIVPAAVEGGAGKILRATRDGTTMEMWLDAAACRHLSALLTDGLPA